MAPHEYAVRSHPLRLGRGVADCRAVETLRLVTVAWWRAVKAAISRWWPTEGATALHATRVMAHAGAVAAVATWTTKLDRYASLSLIHI